MYGWPTHQIATPSNVYVSDAPRPSFFVFPKAIYTTLPLSSTVSWHTHAVLSVATVKLLDARACPPHTHRTHVTNTPSVLISPPPGRRLARLLQTFAFSVRSIPAESTVAVDVRHRPKIAHGSPHPSLSFQTCPGLVRYPRPTESSWGSFHYGPAIQPRNPYMSLYLLSGASLPAFSKLSLFPSLHSRRVNPQSQRRDGCAPQI